MLPLTRPTTLGSLLILTALAPACASNRELARMNPNLPIDTTHGFRQDGRQLDPVSMTEVLASEPASASHVQRARVLTTLGLLLAAAGGGLMGWPLGEKLAGDPHPTWPLLYAGVGVTALSFPVGLWGASSLDGAVEAHNRALGPRR